MASGIETLAQRGAVLAQGPSLAEKFKKFMADPHDPDSNPSGFIDIGTAENHAMLPEVAAFMNKHPVHFKAKDFSYGEGPMGTLRLRTAMANHMNRYFKPREPVDPMHLHFTNGCTSLCDMLGYTMFDEEDGILIAQPSYSGFPIDFGTKAKVRLVHVPFHGVDQFSVAAIDKFEEALKKASSSGIKVRAMMLCSPHNPLGQCYPVDTLIALMQFCNKHRIHMISDEIYGTSVYEVPDESAVPFVSVLSLDYEKYIDRNLLHVMYGMSKDLAGGGLRLGCLLVRNEVLATALNAINQFHWSGIANDLTAAQMLEDVEWMESFLKTSCERLASRNALVRQILDERGVPYSKASNAGFFMWIDLRKWLPDTNGKGERISGWERERELVERFFDNKLNVSPGESQSAEEPGLFRVVFSHDERVVREGLRRLLEVLDGK
ncbi:uncharacterized protein K452DRAFT_329432 [Aplosporella prunicola CBS 121167]|uniref:Aminotransferase class I/classII large domain-containing protein n=1 Tax=Aplosporella prunicola CBS 121167 TaxID=1176127 RepID=A0A6A6AXT9_9PEZI|nr:uncharacterized protein K452DRAFT_292180 [Aplosporella prunicola CBS 121167]XP_033392704.1 uncharacterized protein K452DRAFT_329432 [Aplosporella prunicola CBS 121167]KAF2136749.1 hypothetical protein K452DRAFT_292180 [Aplosporella prunicola CBS 121167]KAF2136986.1 hypothetical protein K452DRAFT_329432 [Aplosporella prunicola CBS 121167]